MTKPKFRAVVYEDASGQFRWRIVAIRGGKIVADSGEAYTRRRDAVRALDRLLYAVVRGWVDATATVAQPSAAKAAKGKRVKR